MARRAVLFVLAALTVWGVGCSKGESDTPAASIPGVADGAPKELVRGDAVALLREVQTHVANGDYEGLDRWFGVPAGRSPQGLPTQVRQLVEDGELSEDGISVLATRGTWGPAERVLPPASLQRHLARFGLGEQPCWALALPPAEVVFCRYPDGKFRMIRLIGLGALTP